MSTTKTVAVEFSRNETPAAHLPLKLGTSRLLYQSSVKFLGVVFDRHLTWSEHIQHVADRCRKRLNLMRAMAGSHWGASRDTLLMVYRALIRSVLDYGCIAYESASTNQKKVLDTIQCKALTIASGALRGTSLAALQVDCGEMPLHLRRKQQMMEFVMKVEAIPDHPTQTITVGRKLKTAKDDSDPIRVKARQINNEIAMPKIPRLVCATKLTWTLHPPVIDTTLREVVRGEGDSIRRRTLVEDHIHTLGASKDATRDGDASHQRRAHVEGQIRTDEGVKAVSTAVYTDGSKNKQGNTSCAFYAHSHDLHRSYRMTDGSSVLAAEMEAIGRARVGDHR